MCNQLAPQSVTPVPATRGRSGLSGVHKPVLLSPGDFHAPLSDLATARGFARPKKTPSSSPHVTTKQHIICFASHLLHPKACAELRCRAGRQPWQESTIPMGWSIHLPAAPSWGSPAAPQKHVWYCSSQFSFDEALLCPCLADGRD